MSQQWNDEQPIYRQLRDRMIVLIMEGVYKQGDVIPSVRQVSREYQINHLTVSKAYQELVTGNLIEKRRGLGMFVTVGARQRILDIERQRFMEIELPAFIKRLKTLKIKPADIILQIKSKEEK